MILRYEIPKDRVYISCSDINNHTKDHMSSRRIRLAAAARGVRSFRIAARRAAWPRLADRYTSVCATFESVPARRSVTESEVTARRLGNGLPVQNCKYKALVHAIVSCRCRR